MAERFLRKGLFWLLLKKQLRGDTEPAQFNASILKEYGIFFKFLLIIHEAKGGVNNVSCSMFNTDHLHNQSPKNAVCRFYDQWLFLLKTRPYVLS